MFPRWPRAAGCLERSLTRARWFAFRARLTSLGHAFVLVKANDRPGRSSRKATTLPYLRQSRIIGRSFERRYGKVAGVLETRLPPIIRARDEFSRRNRSRSDGRADAREGWKSGRGGNDGGGKERERERPPRAFPRTEVEGHPNYPAIGFDGMR